MVIPATLLFGLCVSSLSGASDRVDQLVAREMATHHIPGAVVAVVKDGRVLKQAPYGYANIELGTKCRLDTVFEIGSVTKQFTATLVMMLVQAGRLDLDKSIREVLPEAPASWQPITLRHILSHTSGLVNINDVPGFELRKKLTYDKFMALLARQPLEFEAGEKYAYRNTGYALAGWMIEKTCGKPYEEVLRERLLGPLKMTSTLDRSPEKVIRGRCAGYEWRDGKYWNRDSDLTDVFAAGCLVSNVPDLLKWNAAIDAGMLLDKSSRDAMWTAGRPNDGKPTQYGLGWGVGVYRGERLISHGGSTSGFSASISKFVDRKLTVIVLTNLGTLNNATDLARKIAATYIEFATSD